MTMSYEFQSTLFPSLDSMLNAIAGEWISAGGNNSNEDIRRFFDEATDAELAAEAIEGWGLDRVADFDEEESHKARHDYTAEDLAEAFARIRANPEEHLSGWDSVHPEIADILTNDGFAAAVAADLRGERHVRSNSHSRDKARWLQREDLADEFLAEFDKSAADSQ